MFLTGVLYFIKTFKYKHIPNDEFQEDDHLFYSSNPINRPSIATQTSTMGINDDNVPSTFPADSELNKN